MQKAPEGLSASEVWLELMRTLPSLATMANKKFKPF